MTLHATALLMIKAIFSFLSLCRTPLCLHVSIVIASPHQVRDFFRKIDEIREDKAGIEGLTASGRGNFEPAVKAYLKLRSTTERPPSFIQESPFRAAASALLKHCQDKMATPASMWGSTLQTVVVTMLLERQEAVCHNIAQLKRFNGGAPQKNKSWKDALAGDASRDVVCERYKSTLSKCKGGDMKTDQTNLETAVVFANVHVKLFDKLDAEFAEQESRKIREFFEEAKEALAVNRASKLECWILNPYTSAKDAIDKRDIMIKYSAEFDGAPDIAAMGGREKLLHPVVREMEAEMKGGSTEAACTKTKRQRKS